MDDYDSKLNRLFFSKTSPGVELFTPNRERLYRELTRQNLKSAVLNQLELTLHFAGASAVDKWLNDWLDSSPPQQKIYWRLAVEFALWFQTTHVADERLFAELVHSECMPLVVGNAPDQKPTSQLDFSKNPTITFCAASLLAIYHYPVQLIDLKSETLPPVSKTPHFVLYYRQNEETLFRELSPWLAQFLAKLAEGTPYDDANNFLRHMYPTLDKEHVKTQIAEIGQLGILL